VKPVVQQSKLQKRRTEELQAERERINAALRAQAQALARAATAAAAAVSTGTSPQPGSIFHLISDFSFFSSVIDFVFFYFSFNF